MLDGALFPVLGRLSWCGPADLSVGVTACVNTQQGENRPNSVTRKNNLRSFFILAATVSR